MKKKKMKENTKISVTTFLIEKKMFLKLWKE